MSLLSNSCNIQKHIFQNQKLPPSPPRLPPPRAVYLNEKGVLEKYHLLVQEVNKEDCLCKELGPVL